MPRSIVLGTILAFALLEPAGVFTQRSQTARADSGECVRIEVFIRGDSDRSQAAAEISRGLAKRRTGLAVEVRDVLTDQDALTRVRRILKFYNVERPGLPVVHAAQQVVVGYDDAESFTRRIEDLLTIHVFTREGCPHCAAAKSFLSRMEQRYPGFRVRVHDVVQEPGARDELLELARRHQTAATSVPAFSLCGEFIVGYFGEESTGRRIAELLQKSTVPCLGGADHSRASGSGSAVKSRSRLVTASISPLQASGSQAETNENRSREAPVDELPEDELPLDELPGEDITLEPEPSNNRENPQAVDLPVFGRVSVAKLGLPLFTVAVGLVDGFNPCAMWVLLFLLSILVNLKDRWKILAVAGTFVLISGLAYFAFMAAWLNVFIFIGYLRVAQVILGLLAMFVGLIHIKDFFAFKKGFSLSIPESAKPGIYARVRRIVTAEHLTGAVVGAVVLAVLINMVELLCTAGLPALYTQILALQELPAWQNYAYLGLYNVAYMFDDALMVGIVVTTLGRHRLEERGGRWLKLVSGLVILALGLLLLLKPEWLV